MDLTANSDPSPQPPRTSLAKSGGSSDTSSVRLASSDTEDGSTSYSFKDIYGELPALLARPLPPAGARDGRGQPSNHQSSKHKAELQHSQKSQDFTPNIKHNESSALLYLKASITAPIDIGAGFSLLLYPASALYQPQRHRHLQS